MASLMPFGCDDAVVDSNFNFKPMPTLTRVFDAKLLFVGRGDEPFKLCQELLDIVVDSPEFITSRPSIRVLSLSPEFVNEFEASAQDLQVIAFGDRFDWKNEEIDGLVFVTDYNSLKMEGTKKRREIVVEAFLEHRQIPRNIVHGVIYQRTEPSWLSSIKSAEIFNFKKRLASTLDIGMRRVHWIMERKEFAIVLRELMTTIYRVRVEKESKVGE